MKGSQLWLAKYVCITEDDEAKLVHDVSQKHNGRLLNLLGGEGGGGALELRESPVRLQCRTSNFIVVGIVARRPDRDRCQQTPINGSVESGPLTGGWPARFAGEAMASTSTHRNKRLHADQGGDNCRISHFGCARETFQPDLSE